MTSQIPYLWTVRNQSRTSLLFYSTFFPKKWRKQRKVWKDYWKSQDLLTTFQTETSITQKGISLTAKSSTYKNHETCHKEQNLWRKARKCKFGNVTKSLIKGHIVRDIVNDGYRSCLVKEANLILLDATDLYMWS